MGLTAIVRVILALLATGVIGSQAYARTENGIPGLDYKLRLSDVPLFKDWAPKAELQLSPETRTRLYQELTSQDPDMVRDGIFIVLPDGRIQFLGRRSELDTILRTLNDTHAADEVPVQYDSHRIHLSTSGGGHGVGNP